MASPTYHQLGEHREAVEVVFDPQRISYDQLLDVYWGSFPVNLPPGPSRVRTALLPRGASQLLAAKESKRLLRRKTGDKIATEILPEGAFWPAERMHQKFHLQRVQPELVRELAVAYDGDVDAFLASSAAGRLNAYLTGFAEESALTAVATEIGWEVDELRRRISPEDPG